MKFTESIEAARLRVGAWNRERKERAAEKRAEREAIRPPNAAPLVWCVLLTMVGVAALSGSTWMLLVFIAGSVGHVDWAFAYAATERGVTQNQWHYEADIHLLVGIGLALFCIAIAIFNATWLEARKHLHGLIKTIVTCIGVAVGLFMISGAIVVQQRGTDARARDEVVAAQTAQVGVAEAASRLEYARARLREMRANPNAYMAQAASVGAAEWEHTYIAQARATNDPRLPMIERALGAARAADTQEAEIARLTASQAAAQTTTVQAQAVTVRAGGFMAGPTAILEDARKPITAVLGELLALTAFGFALAAWLSRRQVDGLGAIPLHNFMLDDKSTAERPGYVPPSQRQTAPMDANYKGDVIYDEQGNELRYVEGHVRPKDGKWIPGHYRKTGARQKREIEVEYDGKRFTTGGLEEEPVGDGGVNTHVPVDDGGIGSASPSQSVVDGVPHEDSEAHGQDGNHGNGGVAPGADSAVYADSEDTEHNGDDDHSADGALQESREVQPDLPEPAPTPMATMAEGEAQTEDDILLAFDDESEVVETLASDDASTLSEAEDQPRADEHGEDNAEDIDIDHDDLPEEREPETNPARLIAAE